MNFVKVNVVVVTTKRHTLKEINVICECGKSSINNITLFIASIMIVINVANITYYRCVINVTALSVDNFFLNIYSLLIMSCVLRDRS